MGKYVVARAGVDLGRGLMLRLARGRVWVCLERAFDKSRVKAVTAGDRHLTRHGYLGVLKSVVTVIARVKEIAWNTPVLVQLKVLEVQLLCVIKLTLASFLDARKGRQGVSRASCAPVNSTNCCHLVQLMRVLRAFVIIRCGDKVVFSDDQGTAFSYLWNKPIAIGFILLRIMLQLSLLGAFL